MAVVFSKEQRNVIELRNRNILVSAAAGSGKTTVLVERIIQMITDEEHPVDIDHILVVTFTKAAAASMREKIRDAIEKKLEEAYSEHLQRQATLIHHAQITTIDSFCLFILQNNFNDIGLEPGFRVADEGEIQLLKEDKMDALLEKRLQEDMEGRFAHLLDRFTGIRRIDAFREILFSLYDKALSYPFSEDWIKERRRDYEKEGAFWDSEWMKQVLFYAGRELSYCKELTLQNVQDCQAPGGPILYLPMLQEDLAMVEMLSSCDSYAALHEKMQVLTFARLSSKKDEAVDLECKEAVKKRREEFKKALQNLQKDFFNVPLEILEEGFAENAVIVNELCDTLLEFHQSFREAKKEKKIIDFSDMEHFALDILLKKEGDTYVPTDTALEYREYFHEIMIDEYQDSNLVQEWLLQSVSREDSGVYNRFMVGDVKQSIYQFRLARPQIFMEKYDTYETQVREDTVLQRIDLLKNYRSRKEVLDCVNFLFYRLMGRDLGNVSYDKDSALYPGASYIEKGNEAMDIAELCILQKDGENKNTKEQEAELIAYKIKELLANYYVVDEKSGQVRKAAYRDIVILLRKTKEWDEAFKNVFEREGIPLYVTKSTGYFETQEMKEVLNLLKSLDNPKQDIPLFGTMISWFGKFTDEEMAQIQTQRQDCLYQSVCAWAEAYSSNEEEAEGLPMQELTKQEAELSRKCQAFLTWFSGYRNQIFYEPIHKILRRVLHETGYLYEAASLPNGAQRLANIRMLLTRAESFEKSSYSGLFHFIRYIEKMQKYEIELGEAAAADEQADVVRIMTIHKSKGLEFPICFVAGCGAQFNTRDSKEAIICDATYGIGLDYVDLKQRVKYKDIRRRFLAKHMQEESLGEELRVLYVALTRAKEKLILTGMCADIAKEKEELEKEDTRQGLCHLKKRLGAKSYLDWILAAKPDKPNMAVYFFTPQMLEEVKTEYEISQEWTKETLLQLLAQSKEQKEALFAQEEEQRLQVKRLEQELCFSYPHEALKNLYTKTSVSELKMEAMHRAYEKESQEEGAVLWFEDTVQNPYIPSFAAEEKEVSASHRGSAYHRVLELLDYKELADFMEKEDFYLADTAKKEAQIHEWYCEQMENYRVQGKITQEEIQLVNTKQLVTFLLSPIAGRMAKAALRGELYKEQPFVFGIPANEASKELPSEEKVLIQGIIDVYFIEEDELVLLDYKTDAVTSGKELIKRYQTQLLYYKKALESVVGKKVKEKLMYSFQLQEVVACEV